MENRIIISTVCFLWILGELINNAIAQDLSAIKDQKPVQLSGGFQASSIFYNVSGIANRRQPFSYYLAGSSELRLYGISVPFSISVSESDRSFRQPFNQFGMSPSYKWITVHAGYRNISFSPYTLAGHTVLGAGVELNPGKWRLGFIYGRFNRATTIDTTTQALVPFSFSRKGYAARLGYGGQKTFFELSFLKAKDDSTTAPGWIDPRTLYVTPAGNSVLGYSTRITFSKRIFFESDGALSVLTRDLNSPIPLDSLNNAFLRKIRSFAGINATSEMYTAFSASINYRDKRFGLKAGYRRIEPDFTSMGAYYFNSDAESWTFSPSLNVLKGKVRINGSIGFQHDNVKKQKRATNHRFIGSGNASIDITQRFGVDISYSNFSDNQKPETALFADSLRIIQTTSNISLMPRYYIIKPDVNHIITASLSLNNLSDFNNYFSDQAVKRNISTRQFFINYSFAIPKRQLGLSLNFNSTKLDAPQLDDLYEGITAGANIGFLRSKMNAGITGSFMRQTNDQQKTVTINSSGNLSYKVTAKQILKLSTFLTNNRPRGINLLQNRFTESRTELSYQLNF